MDEKGEYVSVTQIFVFFFTLIFVAFLKHRRTKRRETQFTSIQQRIGTNAQFHHIPISKESFEKGKSWVPKINDIILVCAPKTGTTWLQQLCHQIRTKGHMEFQDIYQVSPWIQLAWDLDQTIDTPQVAPPRIFKTHQRLSAVNKGAKYLCTIRDPVDTLISWYNFLKAHGAPVAVENSLDDFINNKEYVTENMRFGASIWEYYVEFVKCCSLPNVYVLVFEDLVQNIETLIPKIAEFMGVKLSSAEINTVVKLSSKDFMSKCDAFSESWTYDQLVKVGRCPDPESFCPVSKVSAGHHDVFSNASLLKLKEKWDTIVYDQTGIKNYDEMCNFVRTYY
mmetsp:Transcript_22078/g.28588  ORF Transcript_22078/g.28588 Transcript_22078/m.28588 type:complete len:337 (-) Transcript_22078:15-1025(-)